MIIPYTSKKSLNFQFIDKTIKIQFKKTMHDNVKKEN